jgi:hypothetical protein
MPQSPYTIPANLTQRVTGYIVNSALSDDAAVAIGNMQNRLNKSFPDVIWNVPRYALHITLMDWLAPLVDYGQNKDTLFDTYGNKYDETLTDILRDQPPIDVSFDALEAHPGAVILRGHDNGAYQNIRDQFARKTELLPGTKPAPSIIHTTICKFLGEIELADVKAILADSPISNQEKVSEFRLTRETQVFMLNFAVLKRYELDNPKL